MAFTLIAEATGNARGELSNGSSIPGKPAGSGTVTDGAENHFGIVLGSGSGASTFTAVPNTLNNGRGGLAYKWHQDTSVDTAGWGSETITAQRTDFAAELDFNVANRPTSSCNLGRGYSDGAYATSVLIARLLSSGFITVFLGTGNVTVLTTTYALVAGNNYRVGWYSVSATSFRLVIFLIGAGATFTTVYDSGVVTHAVAAPIQSFQAGIGTGSSNVGDMVIQYKIGYGGLATVPVNNPPTITGSATQTLAEGVTTTTVTFTADDTDGTIASFQTPTVTSTADSPPSISAPTLTNINTNHATATYTLTGITNSDTTVSTKAVDSAGAPSTVAASVRVISPAASPKAKAVTLVGCTMTSPSSGTPKDAWNAWLADQLLATPTGVAAPVFTTAAPPATGASVTVDYQPLAIGTTPPNFNQSWALTDTTSTVPIWVDLKFSGVTKATATTTLSSTSPVPVGRVCTTAEDTAIGSGTLSRVAPTVAARFV